VDADVEKYAGGRRKTGALEEDFAISTNNAHRIGITGEI
jgi:hypothetical protein